MSFLTGYAHFSQSTDEVTAEKEHWMRYCHRNLSEIIKMIIASSPSDDLKCICCDDYALNYTTKASLFQHYKSHKQHLVSILYMICLEMTLQMMMTL